MFNTCQAPQRKSVQLSCDFSHGQVTYLGDVNHSSFISTLSLFLVKVHPELWLDLLSTPTLKNRSCRFGMVLLCLFLSKTDSRSFLNLISFVRLMCGILRNGFAANLDQLRASVVSNVSQRSAVSHDSAPADQMLFVCLVWLYCSRFW